MQPLLSKNQLSDLISISHSKHKNKALLLSLTPTYSLEEKQGVQPCSASDLPCHWPPPPTLSGPPSLVPATPSTTRHPRPCSRSPQTFFESHNQEVKISISACLFFSFCNCFSYDCCVIWSRWLLICNFYWVWWYLNYGFELDYNQWTFEERELKFELTYVTIVILMWKMVIRCWMIILNQFKVVWMFTWMSIIKVGIRISWLWMM